MDNIVAELLKPSFWILGVVLSFVINLASAYMKPPMDGLLSKTWGWWRRRTEAKSEAWRARLNELLTSQEAVTRESQRETRFRLLSLALGIQSIAMMITLVLIASSGTRWPFDRAALVVAGICGCWFTVSALSAHRMAAECAAALEEAYEIEKMLS